MQWYTGPIKEGIYPRLHIDRYIAAAGVSKSGLAAYSHLPASYLAPSEDRPLFSFGTACHMIILEQERFEHEVVAYNGVRNGKKWQQFREDYADKLILYPKDLSLIKGMRESVWSYQTFQELMAGAQVEVSAFWQRDGLLLKSRPDIWREDIHRGGDIKTCSTLDDYGIAKTMYGLKYHWQAYMAMEAFALKDFLFVFINKTPYNPELRLHGVRFVLMDKHDKWYDLAAQELEPVMVAFRRSLDKNDWPAYPDRITTVHVPAWAAATDEPQLDWGGLE